MRPDPSNTHRQLCCCRPPEIQSNDLTQFCQPIKKVHVTTNQKTRLKRKCSASPVLRPRIEGIQVSVVGLHKRHLVADTRSIHTQADPSPSQVSVSLPSKPAFCPLCQASLQKDASLSHPSFSAFHSNAKVTPIQLLPDAVSLLLQSQSNPNGITPKQSNIPTPKQFKFQRQSNPFFQSQSQCRRRHGREAGERHQTQSGAILNSISVKQRQWQQAEQHTVSRLVQDTAVKWWPSVRQPSTAVPPVVPMVRQVWPPPARGQGRAVRRGTR